MPPYPHIQDQIYRWSLLSAAAGMAVETIAWLFLPASRWRAVGEGWTLISLGVAGWTFLVWLRSWRILVRGLVTSGALVAPFLPVVGWAFGLSGAAIMAAKETHCFHFRAGRIIPWYTLALGVTMLIPRPALVEGLGWLGLASLWTWLVAARWQLPLFEI